MVWDALKRITFIANCRKKKSYEKTISTFNSFVGISCLCNDNLVGVINEALFYQNVVNKESNFSHFFGFL